MQHSASLIQHSKENPYRRSSAHGPAMGGNRESENVKSSISAEHHRPCHFPEATTATISFLSPSLQTAGLGIHSRYPMRRVGGIISIGVADWNRLARARGSERGRRGQRSFTSCHTTSDCSTCSSSSFDFVFPELFVDASARLRPRGRMAGN